MLVPGECLAYVGDDRGNSAFGQAQAFPDVSHCLAETVEPLIEFYTTPGGNDEKISIFWARGLKFVGHDLELEGEEIDMTVHWVPLNEAVQSILASKVKSPAAQVGLMALALKWGQNATETE